MGLSSIIFYSYVTLVTLLALGGGVSTPDVTYWAPLGLSSIIFYSFVTLVTLLVLGGGVF